MTTDLQTLNLAGETFVVLPKTEFDRLRAAAGEPLAWNDADDDPAAEGPTLPALNTQGRYPAVEYARASLARKLIRRRRAAGLTQAELARRAGIRAETLNRIERGVTTPSVATVEKINRALIGCACN